TILGRAEETFDPSLGLRAVRQDQLHVQLLQGSAKLRQPLGRPTLALPLENTVFIGIERQRPTVATQPTFRQVHVRLDGFTLVKPGLDPTGGIIDHRYQNHLLAATLQPVVYGGVHLDQLAKTTPPRPPAPMHVPSPL